LFEEEHVMKTSHAVMIGMVALVSAGSAMGQGGMGSAGGRGPSMTQPGAMMGQMDQRIKAMQELHQQMLSATTPEERQKIMEEGRKEFQQGMTMMQPMMQGGGMMGGGSRGPGGKAPSVGTQMQFMNKRMDMMQMMMQTMLDQQGVVVPPGGGAGAPSK
jgi:hypothetical protein